MKTLTKHIFTDINDCVFDGALDMPILDFTDTGDFGNYWAFHKAGFDYMNVNPELMVDFLDIFGTIAHEMCHQANYRIDGLHWSKVNHGKRFKYWAEKIADIYNFPIDRIL